MKPAAPLTQAPRNILILKTSSLGDIAACLPVPALLKRRWPETRISWLVNRGYMDLVRLAPEVDEAIAFDRDAWRSLAAFPANLMRLGRMLRDIRGRRFDLTLDFQGQLRSALIGCCSGAPLRFGPAAAREGAWLFYSRRIPAAPGLALEEHMAIVRAAAGEVPPPQFSLSIPEPSRARTRALLQELPEGAPRVLLCPGARWKTKCWPVPAFARLARELASRNVTVVLGGSAQERAAGEAIAREAGGSRVLNLCGQTPLLELCALIAGMDLVVCNDSGPMHLAAAFGVPLVALFGPTDPNRTGPYTARGRILRSDVDCSPCLRRHCVRPDGKRCMDRIAPERVLAETLSMLGRGVS